ncbi:GNAT family N-acetyltransferase [Pseudovibrio sp. SPO723]|uniref:GNAT family N-acetyltransferase n=1 Tax=Nesiotobacter zosterae TaxID=392721 RepID=UPI0029C52244|nr:GNAT family N-acetyltransferase [Pseudovibrio sp. SPO723]MDX5595343.1 GNAT family N-acetyltransferase [Pseudovibrio sp. SPO723]
MSTQTLHLDGYTVLPKDKVAFVVTYLEMNARPELKQIERPDLTLEQAQNMQPDAFRDLFRAVGEKWLWFGRLTCSDQELRDILSEPNRELYLPMKDGRPVGILELNFDDPHNVELAYFGLIPDVVGGGAGRWLMNQAIDMVFSREKTRRLWLHTCTGDSPQAISFYQRSGFVPFKRAIEVADDPRVSGVLPADCAGHVPYLK